MHFCHHWLLAYSSNLIPFFPDYVSLLFFLHSSFEHSFCKSIAWHSTHVSHNPFVCLFYCYFYIFSLYSSDSLTFLVLRYFLHFCFLICIFFYFICLPVIVRVWLFVISVLPQLSSAFIVQPLFVFFFIDFLSWFKVFYFSFTFFLRLSVFPTLISFRFISFTYYHLLLLTRK